MNRNVGRSAEGIRKEEARRRYRMLSLNGALGYSFPEASLDEAMKRRPDLIADDAGSMDAGPYYLGEGASALKGAAG